MKKEEVFYNVQLVYIFTLIKTGLNLKCGLVIYHLTGDLIRLMVAGVPFPSWAFPFALSQLGVSHLSMTTKLTKVTSIVQSPTGKHLGRHAQLGTTKT